jgi:hypothetical protein
MAFRTPLSQACRRANPPYPGCVRSIPLTTSFPLLSRIHFTYLRLLEYEEDLRSVRQIEDHIQATQVLKLLIHRLAHALCMCLMLGLAWI